MAWDAALDCLQAYAPDKAASFVVGVSGGVDSVALVHFLHASGYKSVICCYIDHGLRTDTDKDWECVSHLAKECGYQSVRSDIAQILARSASKNVENAARNARYAALEELRIQYNAQWVMTAHHQNDLVESQLMHFVRGCGLYGLVGISAADQDRHLLRPLLAVSKAQIVQYAEQQELIWHEDSTNREIQYTRNRLRHNVIPQLEEAFPSLLPGASEMSSFASEILAFHTQLVEESLGKIGQIQAFDFSAYLQLPAVLQKHMLVMLARLDRASYTAGHINSLHVVLTGDFVSGKTLRLTKNTLLERSFEKIRIVRQPHREIQQPGPLPTSIHLPKEYAQRDLHVTLLTPTSRLRCYTSEQGDWKVWHTTFKKWRMSRKISWQEGRTIQGLLDPQTGEVVAVFHELWQYPEGLPLVEMAFPPSSA